MKRSLIFLIIALIVVILTGIVCANTIVPTIKSPIVSINSQANSQTGSQVVADTSSGGTGTKGASWHPYEWISTHGNAMTVEDESAFNDIWNPGWGSQLRLKAGAGSWVQAPITTPGPVSSSKLYGFKYIKLRYAVSGSAYIDKIHVYVSDNCVRQLNTLHLSSTAKTTKTINLGASYFLRSDNAINLCIHVQNGATDNSLVILYSASARIDKYY